MSASELLRRSPLEINLACRVVKNTMKGVSWDKRPYSHALHGSQPLWYTKHMIIAMLKGLLC